MLPDLTKDILQEMGIAVMGDVLAVMRQARLLSQAQVRAAVFACVQSCVSGNGH